MGIRGEEEVICYFKEGCFSAVARTEAKLTHRGYWQRAGLKVVKRQQVPAGSIKQVEEFEEVKKGLICGTMLTP